MPNILEKMKYSLNMLTTVNWLKKTWSIFDTKRLSKKHENEFENTDCLWLLQVTKFYSNEKKKMELEMKLNSNRKAKILRGWRQKL